MWLQRRAPILFIESYMTGIDARGDHILLCGLLFFYLIHSDMGDIKMKRIITSALLIATTLSLVACSTNKSASSSAEKKDETTLVSRKKTDKKKKASSTKKKSPKKSDQKKDSNNNQQATDQNSTQQNNTNQQAQNQTSNQSQQASGTNTNNQQQTSQNDQNTQQQSSGISYDENTLTGFVNKYGVSPALYKEQHGMSTIQALESTPDSMKTFGEQQLQTGIENGTLNPDGSASNQYGY